MKKFYNDNCAIFSTIKIFNNIALFNDERFCRLIIDNLNFYRNKYSFKLHGYVIMPTHLHLLFHFPYFDQDDGRAIIYPNGGFASNRVTAGSNNAYPNEESANNRVLADPDSQNPTYLGKLQDEGGAIIYPDGETTTDRVLVGHASQKGKHYTDFLRDFKSHTARQIIDKLKQENSIFLNHLKFSGPKNYQYKIWYKSNYDFNVYSDRKFEEKLNYIHNNPLRARLVKNLDDYP